MRRLLDRLTRTLRDFVKQRDDLLLLVPCGDNDVALLMKVLRDLDRESPSHLFLLFAEDFQSPREFLDRIAAGLQEEHSLATRVPRPDGEKLPPLPAALPDAGKPPAARLVSGLEYARSLIDPRLGQRFVWGMGPGAIQDAASYLKLLAALPPQPDVLPWMRGARIVARVPADFDLARSPLAGAKRVRVEPLVVPPDIHEQELLATAADETSPPGERMQAEVQLAFLDSAHGRFAPARDRFWRTLAFFQQAGSPAMEGLIIGGLGDMARRQGDWRQAQHWYECAAVPAAESGNGALLAYIVQNLAAVAYHEQRFQDAEERYSELVSLKRAAFDEVGLAEALEWQGVCQEKRQAYDQAVLSWRESAMICKVFEMTDRLPTLLGHLKRGYQRLRLREELEKFDAEWNA
jgi:tetratricopeptide (TPR) repeat protein